MGLAIALGAKGGGWMMVVYLVIKLTIWYIPPLLQIPKMPFINREFT
jgi:hypothetical protein